MLLENELLKLRALEPEDLELLYRWENDSELWEVGNTRSPYSRFMLKQYISQSDTNIYENKQLRLMMVSVQSNQTVGTVDLFDFDIHNSRIALGLFVDEAFQGKGYAKAALKLTEGYVFNFLRINQLYVHIASTNKASISMFEKENFEKTGVLKNWIKSSDGYTDIVLFQQFRNQYLTSSTK